jgi:hypothetical protein
MKSKLQFLNVGDVVNIIYSIILILSVILFRQNQTIFLLVIFCTTSPILKFSKVSPANPLLYEPNNNHVKYTLAKK